MSSAGFKARRGSKNMKDIKKGSCLCGEIQFEYIGTPFSFNLCHCKMCQKFGGGAFSSYIGLNKEKFKYIKGGKLEKVYISSEWASRTFCSKCGSPLRYIYHDQPESIFICAGLFEGDPGIKPNKHIFVKDKCEWFEITDILPQVEKY